MQDILNWTINTIREESIMDSTWLEERKFDWTPLVVKSLKSLLHNNSSVLILTDNDRSWFGDYILTNINNIKNNRPYLPFYDFTSICKQFVDINTHMNTELIIDMLNISFPNGYYFWYIGKSNDKKSIIPKYLNNSFLWLLDDELPNSMSFKSNDQNIDTKLLQIFKLYNKTLNAVLFADVTMD